MASNNPETNRRILDAARYATEALRKRQEENPQETQRREAMRRMSTLAHLADIRANQARTVRELEGERYKGFGSAGYDVRKRISYGNI